jgi:mRNA interferase RelE/StbE
LVWRIEFDSRAVKELSKFDKPIQRRILTVLKDRIAPLEDPRSIGEALRGEELGRFWKYRVGPYRIICDIRDAEIVILVLRIGDRKEIYER